VQLKKYLLGQVFGFRKIAYHAQAQGVNAPFVQGVKLREGLMVAALGAGQCIVLNLTG
jgi:hypothetical protein